MSGPDDFTIGFFQKIWGILKEDVMSILNDFFNGRGSLQHINSTLVTLIPKTPKAYNIYEYRPISCVITIYKIVSTLLAARLGEVTPELISTNQSTFVRGRNISHNIMLAEEHLRGFNQK